MRTGEEEQRRAAIALATAEYDSVFGWLNRKDPAQRAASDGLIRRAVRALGMITGVPVVKRDVLRRRAPSACFRRWAIPNAVGLFNGGHQEMKRWFLTGGWDVSEYVDDDDDGATMLFVTP